MHQAKEITKGEARYLFLKYMTELVDYWDKETRVEDTREKLEGLLHSILVTLDGGAMAMPGFYLIPCTHEDDKQYAIDNGHDYYPYTPQPDYELGGALHEEMYRYIRGKVKKPANLKTFSDHLMEKGKEQGFIQ